MKICVKSHSGGIMKIIPNAYTDLHSGRALKRLHKGIVRNKVAVRDLHKLYKAMLHLERYIDRLAQN